MSRKTLYGVLLSTGLAAAALLAFALPAEAGAPPKPGVQTQGGNPNPVVQTQGGNPNPVVQTQGRILALTQPPPAVGFLTVFGRALQFQITSDTQVVRNGKPAHWSALRVGDAAGVVYSPMTGVAYWIVAAGP